MEDNGVWKFYSCTGCRELYFKCHNRWECPKCSGWLVEDYLDAEPVMDHVYPRLAGAFLVMLVVAIVFALLGGK